VVRDFAAGVLDGVRGATYLARHRQLWRWVLAPALVVTFVAVAALGWLVALVGAIGLVGWTSLAIASATVIVTFAALIAGPFNERLSESIEELESGERPPRFNVARYLYELAVGVAHAARRGAAYVLFVVLLLAIGHFVPVGGAVLAAIGSAWVTARFASYDAYDSIWARRHLRYRQKTARLREQRWRTLGLGALMATMLVVPGLNVIGLAIGAAGATLRVVGEERGSG
jgi:CysZ protein